MNKFDINKVAETNRQAFRMMKTMHKALAAIATTEHGLDGGITARAIACDALVRSHKIANAGRVTIPARKEAA